MASEGRPVPDVVVLGGGPAGLLAALFAARAGAAVLVLERMREPLRKLRITGKGRCNLTNTADLRDFLAEIGPGAPFLKPSFRRFFNQDTRAFFESIGVGTVVERGGRVFPESNSAVDVAQKLRAHAEASGVVLRCGARARRFVVEGGRITGIELADGEVVAGRAFVLATGGASYPATGSTGDGYALARELGHRVTPIRPALVPLETEGETAGRLQGLSLVNAQAGLWIDGRKAGSAFGEMIFTHFGLSGPIVLTLSRQCNQAVQEGKAVEVAIDLKPALDDRKLDLRLLRDLDANGRMKLANLFKQWLPAKLIPEFLRLLGLDGDTWANQVDASARKRIRVLMKDLRFKVTALRPFSEAIITSGGIALDEVRSRTLGSKLHPNLFFAGEVLDLAANTGGYNLQIAFSTGVLAGESAARSGLGGAGEGEGGRPER